MAISEFLPGVEIAVTVDGQKLPEHRDEDTASQDRTTTCYIEATTGKNFEIRVIVKMDCRFLGNALSLAFGIDGSTIDSPLISKEDLSRSDYTYVSKGSWSTGQLRKYQFSSVETGE